MINKSIIGDMLNEALLLGGEYAEVFLEDNFSTEISTVGGNVERGMSGREYGIGIRIFSGLNFLYAFTNDFSKENLLALTRKLTKNLKKQKNDPFTVNFDKRVQPSKHPFDISPSDVELIRKLEIANRATKSAMNYDELISQVTVNYLDKKQNVIIANTEGLYVEDTRVRTRLHIIAAAEQYGQIETGYIGAGALMGPEFYDQIDVEEIAAEAARNAKTMVQAEHCPSGNMPVVIDNGFGGLMIHEACGHSLEASSVAKGHSVFSNKIGQKIASEIVTLVDDGTIKNSWGSLGVDDEGSPTQRNVLIENGILKGYMIDKLNAKRMGLKPTGSARRESYRFAPTSRMTNTYIANGKCTKEEIIKNTEKGLFAKHISAGSVNPATGVFNFSLSEAYIIENGKVTKPVRGATLIGNGNSILHDIDMVGNNLEIGSGYCFAGSGAVYIGAGQPTIRVKLMTVGGREA